MWFAQPRGCGSLRGGMTFPVHRSRGAHAVRARRGLRARAGAARSRTRSRCTAACSRRPTGADAREEGERRRLDARGRRRSPGIATGAAAGRVRAARRQRPHRDPRRPGPGRSARWSAPAACSPRTGTGTPTPAASTVVWIVEHEHGWFATLTEAGMLAKIGLNDAGLGVCLNLLNTTADGGLDGTPIHLLLRRRCRRCRTRRRRDRAAHRARRPAPAPPSRSRPPNDVASVELITRRRERHPRPASAPTRTTSSSRRARARTSSRPSPRARSRASRSSARQPLLDALAATSRTPRASAATSTRAEPWVDQTVTVASVVMNLAARRFHVAAGQPCTHEHVQIAMPRALASFGVSPQRQDGGQRERARRSRPSDSQIGTCQTSISSIFTPMNARITASPCVR